MTFLTSPLPLRIGGAILTNELNDLALSLSFLNRLGLFPIVLHGAGPQLYVLRAHDVRLPQRAWNTDPRLVS